MRNRQQERATGNDRAQAALDEAGILLEPDAAPFYGLPGLSISTCTFASVPLARWHFEALGVAYPATMVQASAVRRSEFLAGRVCSHIALLQAGLRRPVAVDVLPDRSPAWPAGFCGSISHSAGRAIAVAAASRAYWGVGVDLQELISPRNAALTQALILGKACSPVLPWPAHVSLTLVFSAKESAFKALYPFRRLPLDFDDFHVVSLDQDKQRLLLSCATGPAGGGCRQVLQVAYRLYADHVKTLAALPRTLPAGPGSHDDCIRFDD